MRSLVLLLLIGFGVAGTEVPAYVRNVGPNFSSGGRNVGPNFSSGERNVGPNFSSGVQHVKEFWPNGNLRRTFDLRGDVRHGEYRTFTIDGKPYELKHFRLGKEDGLQQAWDERGELYLNYEVKNGRRYGMVNAKPCLPANADGTSQR